MSVDATVQEKANYFFLVHNVQGVNSALGFRKNDLGLILV